MVCFMQPCQAHPAEPPLAAFPLCLPRWYGPGEPQKVFVERKTHRDSWKGEESVKERFAINSDKVVPFMEGEYTADMVRLSYDTVEM